MTDSQAAWLALIAAIAGAAVTAAFRIWHKKALEFRRRFIRVQPSLRAPFDQDIPGPESLLIAQMVPALKELGFEIAANGHCPEIELGAAWTQVLFLNRAVGDRASLIVKRTSPSAIATIAFATEAPRETQVTSSFSHQIYGYNAPSPDTPPPAVKALYVKHRQAVVERAFLTEQRVLPEVGKEHQWLHERAALVAKTSAEKHGMVQIGECYRIPSRSCALSALKWIGQKFNPRRKRAQPKAKA